MKSQLIGKDPDAGKDGGQEEKGAPEGEIVGWHHQLNGHEFEQTLRESEGQGRPGCCSPWGWEELGTTERLHSSRITWPSSSGPAFDGCSGPDRGLRFEP